MTTTAPERATDQDAGTEAAAEAVDEVLSSRWKARLSKWGVPALLAVAGVALIVGGLALTWGGGDQKPAPYTVLVAYQVTGDGTANITYLDNLKDGQEQNTSYGHRRKAHLPWHASAHVTPDSGPATVTVQLGAGGGHASCRITVRGREVQMATASRAYGRAVCTADIPPRQK